MNFANNSLSTRGLLLASLLFGFSLVRADDPLTYELAAGNENWPADIRLAIIDAMDEAVGLYNGHGYFEKSLWVNYNPGVPTAQASYSGSIEFGNLANSNTRVALHEIAHTLGGGQHAGWNANRSGNTWTGQHGIRQVRHFDGPSATLNADAQHFWPYGLNQNSEDGPINRIRHIETIAAMRRDMGIVAVHEGVPADWQMFRFGFVDEEVATRDFDGDSFTELEEYTAFTDPADPLSFPGAPSLLYRWAMNETVADSDFARLDPTYDPVSSRKLSASISGAEGPSALFVKGDSADDLPPIYGEPASKGDAFALGSTGSFGPASSSARIELGHAARGNSPLTFAFWFKRTGSAATHGLGEIQHIVSGTEDDHGFWNLHALDIDEAGDNTFDLRFVHHGLEQPDQARTIAMELSNDTWYHAAIARDVDGLLRVYLDAEEVFSDSVSPYGAPFLATQGAEVSADATVAFWHFDEGPARSFVAPGQDNILDASGNGNELRTFNTDTAPSYVTDLPFSTVPQTGEPNLFALNYSGGNRDLYSSNQPLNAFPFDELTVEASFNVDSPDAFQVIVGKDGNPIGGQPPFTLKVRNDRLLEVAIADGAGTRRQVMSQTPLTGGVWYSAAASITQTEMALWLKGPGDADYVLQNTIAVDGLFNTATSSAWVVGRGMWNGGLADRFNGLIDEVRISNKAYGASHIFLGHDVGSDPTLSFIGLYDDARVYDKALQPHEVRALLGVQIMPPAHLEASLNSFGEATLEWQPAEGATSYIVKRANASRGTYTEIGVTSDTHFVDTDGEWGSLNFYAVSSVTDEGESGNSNEAQVAVGLIPHIHLPFDEVAGQTAPDLTGNGWTGILQNQAIWEEGRFNNAVALDGTDQYVSLPEGAIADLSNFTIATWVKLDSVDHWSRVFDFGSGESTYMFLTPQAGGSNTVRFAIKTGGSGGEQIINGTAALPTGAWTHVAVTLAGNEGTLYVNGSVVGRNRSMSIHPSDLGNTTQNWIGRSQYPDPYLNGAVDEFYIFNGALTESEINALMDLGILPPPPPPSDVQATGNESGNVLTWEASEGALSYSIWRSASSDGPFLLLAEDVSNLTYTDETATPGDTYFYAVSAVNAAGVGRMSSKTTPEELPFPISPAETRAPELTILNGEVRLVMQSVEGRTYQLQRRADLTDGQWIDVGASTIGTGSEHHFTDTYNPAAPHMFYRVLIVP